ncbi:diguanylate cyclase, partial [Klebsiella pneumoniae]|nr:diguanylate cyclase [Klebsiella pneumoniae]MCP6594518.1 diguanylate cyclase [Klebsiella pneumoniae]
LNQLFGAMNSLVDAVEDRQRQLLDMAHTDALTRLALRSRFTAAVDELLARDPAAPVALLCLDVDRLKMVNNVLGFEAGDSLLCGLAQR